MEHKLVRLADAGPGLNAHGRHRHIIPGRFVRMRLGVELPQYGFAHFVQGHGTDGGRSGVSMPAAAQRSADVAHVDRLAAAAGHHLDAVFHPADGKEHREFFHFHQAVRQVGKIAQIVLHGGLGQSHAHVVDDVGLHRLQQTVEGLNVQAGELVGGQVIYAVHVHALTEQPGRGLKVLFRRGGIGEGTRIAVNAQAQQGGFFRGKGNAALTQVAHHQAGQRAHAGRVGRVRRHVVGSVGVVVPDFQPQTWAVQQGSHMPHAAALTGVYQHQTVKGGPVQAVGGDEVVGLGVQAGIKFLQAAFLRAGKEQHAGSIKPTAASMAAKASKSALAWQVTRVAGLTRGSGGETGGAGRATARPAHGCRFLWR